MRLSILQRTRLRTPMIQTTLSATTQYKEGKEKQTNKQDTTNKQPNKEQTHACVCK